MRFSCGAGEATVNLSAGNAIFQKGDIAVGSGCYTVAVSHVYTTAIGELADEINKNRSETDEKFSLETYAGKNWKLGIQQYVIENPQGTYRYMDANGYLHEFASIGGNKYYATSGAGLTLTVGGTGNPYILTGDDGLSRMEFDAKGRLVIMAVKTGVNADGADRESVKFLSYDSGNEKLTEFYDLDDLDSAGRYRKIAFSYSESGLLRSAVAYRKKAASSAQGGSSGIAAQAGSGSAGEGIAAQTAAGDYEETDRETYVYNKKGELIASYYTKKKTGAEGSAAEYGSRLSAYFEYDSVGRLVLAADGADGSAVKFAYGTDGKVSAVYNAMQTFNPDAATGANVQFAEYEEAGPLLGGVLFDEGVTTASAQTVNDFEKACRAAGTALTAMPNISATHYKSATEFTYESCQTVATQYIYDRQNADRQQGACYVYAMNAAGETLSVVERVKSGAINDTVSVTPDLEGTRGFRLSAPVSGSEPAFNGRRIESVGIDDSCRCNGENYLFLSPCVDIGVANKLFSKLKEDGGEYVFSAWVKSEDGKAWNGNVVMRYAYCFTKPQEAFPAESPNDFVYWTKSGQFNGYQNCDIPLELDGDGGWKMISRRIRLPQFDSTYNVGKITVKATEAVANDAVKHPILMADMRLTEVSALPQFSSGDFLDDIVSVNLGGEIFYIDQRTTFLTQQDVEKSRKNAVMAGENNSFAFIYDNGKKAKMVSYVSIKNRAGEDFPFRAADFFSSVTEDEMTMTTKMSYGADGSSVSTVTAKAKKIQNTETAVFNRFGQKVSETDAYGVTTEYAYDKYGNLTAETVRGSGSNTQTIRKQYRYDSRGEYLTSVIDERGIETKTEYNADGMASKSIAPKPSSATGTGNETNYAYDNLGRLKTASLTETWGDYRTSYTYDKQGRLTKVQNAASVTYGVEYDDFGEVKRFYSGSAENGSTIFNRGVEVSFGLTQEWITYSNNPNETVRTSYDCYGRVVEFRVDNNAVSNQNPLLTVTYADRNGEETTDAETQFGGTDNGKRKITSSKAKVYSSLDRTSGTELKNFYKYNENDELVAYGYCDEEWETKGDIVRIWEEPYLENTRRQNTNIRNMGDSAVVVEYDSNVLIRPRIVKTITGRCERSKNVDKDNLSGFVIEYTYDSFGRIAEKKTEEFLPSHKYTVMTKEVYSYLNVTSQKTTNYIESVSYYHSLQGDHHGAFQDDPFKVVTYTYAVNGSISSMKENLSSIYDDTLRVREENDHNFIFDSNLEYHNSGSTKSSSLVMKKCLGENVAETKSVSRSFAYNSSGNILSLLDKDARDLYYSTTNVYENGSDRLSENCVRGNVKPIAYDSCGNPVSYNGATLSWKRGSVLSSFEVTDPMDGTFDDKERKVDFYYNASGMRTKIKTQKGDHSKEVEFYLDGDKILGEKCKGVYLQFLYDESGLCGIIKGTGDSTRLYHVLKSVDGSITDVLYDNFVVAKFNYDTSGNQQVIVHPVIIDADRDLRLNHGFEAEYCPFRFRGHYYDTDTGLYYIDKKYYDSTNSSFVTPCNFRELWYNVGEVFGGVSRYALPGGSADALGVYAPGPFACLDLSPIGSSSVKISWWQKALSWFAGLSNVTKWIIGAVTFAAAIGLTYLSGGAMLPLFVKMGLSIGIGGLLQGTISAIKGDGFLSGLRNGIADGVMFGGVTAFVGAAIRYSRFAYAVMTKNKDILAKLFTHNAKKGCVMLGKYVDGGPTSYVAKAGTSYTYYQMPVRIFKQLEAKLGKDFMWEINESFLRQQSTKFFFFSHPIINQDGWFLKELNYLKNHGLLKTMLL